MCVLGDDAQEEEGENPFANLINNPENEKLYIDDPKKALKGYFEREGTWYFFYKKRGNILIARKKHIFCHLSHSGDLFAMGWHPLSSVVHHPLTSSSPQKLNGQS